MAAGEQSKQAKSLRDVVSEIGLYPVEAFDFVQQGLGYTVNKLHGQAPEPQTSRHVSGPQLCEGLREYALMQWGMLAEMVLRRWNINATYDFGRIVFALVNNGFMQRTDQDCIEDFRGVYDFKSAFAHTYKIESRA